MKLREAAARGEVVLVSEDRRRLSDEVSEGEADEGEGSGEPANDEWALVLGNWSFVAIFACLTLILFTPPLLGLCQAPQARR